jgi:hypothetical protein
MRRIALVGTASSGCRAPYHDTSWEIWGVSARAAYVTRANRWFELHRLDGEPEDWANKWRETLKGFARDIPEVIMMYPEPGLAPKVTAYPFDRITARFGTYFMTSTFAWMMALALDELRPVDGKAVDGEIAIYGVDMEYGTEYRQQRSGFRHFIDVARVMGVPVTRLADGGLAFEPVPYPMWQDDPLLAKVTLRQGSTKSKIETLNESLRATRTLIAQNKAVIAELDNPAKDPVERRAYLAKETDKLLATSAQLSKDVVHWTAIDEEQSWLADYLQP